MHSEQDHHHTQVTSHRRPGTGRLQSLAGALLLAWAVLHGVPARAGHVMEYSDVACGGGLKLSHASGVPGSVHSYVFGGVCSLRTMFKTGPWVEAHPPLAATARWDNSSHTYSEHVHLLQAIVIKQYASHDSAKNFYSDVPVSTDPEDASFKCDEDPVINKGAHCSLVSQYNGTGWGDQHDGFAWNAVRGRPLLAGRATLSQARALSKHNALISCSGLHLTAATGAPNGKLRSYKFSGTCELYHTADGSGGLQVTHVLANGKWDALAQQAEEGVTVLTNPIEGGGGWSTKYTCTDDPWLNPGAKCSKTFQLGNPPPVYDPITDVLARHPITMGRVNAKLAAQLSEQSSHQKSSAHAGKQQGPSVIHRGIALGGARGNPKNLHLSSAYPPSPASRVASNRFSPQASRSTPPGSMQARASMHVPPPNVRLLSETYQVDQSCSDMHRLIVVTATVRNDGGPLPMHRWRVFVMEGGGADLDSGSVWVPPLGLQGQTDVEIPVNVLKGFVPKLPGTHSLSLIAVDDQTGHNTKTAMQPITLPAGICQPKLQVSSPAGLRMQPRQHFNPPPGTKLNPQPEPPAPVHHMSLPTVQSR
jgi:hypothetical protein